MLFPNNYFNLYPKHVDSCLFFLAIWLIPVLILQDYSPISRLWVYESKAKTHILNNLLTSKDRTLQKNSQTSTLLLWPSNCSVNTTRSQSENFPVKTSLSLLVNK